MMVVKHQFAHPNQNELGKNKHLHKINFCKTVKGIGNFSCQIIETKVPTFANGNTEFQLVNGKHKKYDFKPTDNKKSTVILTDFSIFPCLQCIQGSHRVVSNSVVPYIEELSNLRSKHFNVINNGGEMFRLTALSWISYCLLGEM